MRLRPSFSEAGCDFGQHKTSKTTTLAMANQAAAQQNL